MSALKYYPDLVTLNYMRRHRELSSTETTSDDILKDLIHGVSSSVIRLINRVPMPYVDTKIYDFTADNVWNSYLLYLNDDLLSVSTLTNDGASVAASAYVLRPANNYPKQYIRLKRTTDAWTFTDEPENAISVAGTWGYVPHHEREWLDSGIDVPEGGISASETSKTILDSSGFEVLQYIRINSETLQITANDTSTNTLTFTRGELGTIATAHSEGDDIETYYQLPDLTHDVARIVGYLYKTLHEAGGQLQVLAGAAVAVEQLDPTIARGLRQKYRRERLFIA